MGNDPFGDSDLAIMFTGNNDATARQHRTLISPFSFEYSILLWQDLNNDLSKTICYRIAELFFES